MNNIIEGVMSRKKLQAIMTEQLLQSGVEERLIIRGFADATNEQLTQIHDKQFKVTNELWSAMSPEKWQTTFSVLKNSLEVKTLNKRREELKVAWKAMIKSFSNGKVK